MRRPRRRTVNRQLAAILLPLLATAACTSVLVQPLPPGHHEVVIVPPARDEVPGLLDRVRQALTGRGIACRIAADAPADATTVRLYYDSKVWDDANRIFRAEITLMQGNHRIGYVGYIPEKSAWLSATQAMPTGSRLQEALDALLRDYAPRTPPEPPPDPLR